MKKFVSIIISGEPKSGKSTLAGMLAKAYGWKRLSLGDMWREKWRKLYPNEEIPFDVFWKGTTIDENRRMNVEAKKIYEKGKMIGDSRFVSYLDPSKCLLVFMTASLETRAKRSVKGEYRGKNMTEIKRLLKKRESDEVIMGRKLFKNDYRNPEHYHLILNSDILTPKQEFNIVRSIV